MGVSFDLAQLARRARNIRRRQIVLRDIVPPATLATDLFRTCYLPVLASWEEAAARILTAYERTLAELTTDAPSDIQGEIEAGNSAFLRLLVLLSPRLRSWAVRTEAWFRGKWRGAILSASGVDLSTIIGPEGGRQSIEQTVAWNTSLIRDVSDQLRQRISAAVFSGLQQRQPAREVAAAIRGASEMARRRAMLIASDQLSKLASSLADERRREAGITKWKWRHSGKLHPRKEHLARNGKVYTDETAPADRPGQLPYCGCRAQSVIEFD